MSRSLLPLRRRSVGLAAGLLASAFIAAEAPGQTAPAGKAAAAPAGPPPVSAAYAARDKLILYVEFDGLDAHEDAWRRTVAYRMIHDTPLGKMLETVGATLLERGALSLPNRKINGADAVAIVKHVAAKGFVLALHADPAVSQGARGVLVLRGADAKEAKGLLSRLAVSFMNPNSKHKLERKGTHQLVVVPPPDWDGKTPDKGWSWWAEGGDFVFTLLQPSDADGALAALDGKVPNAVDYEPVSSLSQADAGVAPVLKAYFNPSLQPAGPESPMNLPGDSGVQRVEYRWGFQDDALVSSTRLVAPRPRQGALAFLDDPAFEAKKLLPIPEGVESFVSASLKPEQWASMIAGSLGSGGAKPQYDAFVENLRTRSRTEFEKDLLGNIGPRVMVYLAPGGSTAAAASLPPANVSDPMAVFNALGPALPRPVIVAEIADASRFARALDAVMLEVNREIKGVFAEQIADAVKAEAAKPSPGGLADDEEDDDPGSGRRDRKKKEPAIPEFRLLPSSGGDTARTYMLNVPTNSAVKLPTGFKPTIRLEGNLLAVSTSPEAARAAADVLKRKPWTPPEAIAQPVSKTPDPAVLLLFGDFREATAATLATLPGTLQTGINTAIAASDRLIAATSGNGADSGGNRRDFNADGSSEGFGGAPGGPGGQGGKGTAAGPALVQLRVDPASLPRADELKSMMFPSTSVVTVDETSVRFVTRTAFPDLTALLGVKGFLPGLLAQPIAAARQAGAAAAAAPAGQPGTNDGAGPGDQPGR